MQLTRDSLPMISTGKSSAIVGGQDNYRFTVLADGLLRYEWAPDKKFEDRPSVFATNRDQPVPDYRVKESEDSLEIITSRFHLTYDKQEFSPNGLSAVVHRHTRRVWRYGQPTDSLGGTTRTLDNADGRVPFGPGVTSRNGYTTIDDSDSMLFGEDGFVASRLPGPGRVDGYIFAYGHDYRDAVKALYAISGFQPLLPRWALGNWWSRYHKYSADSYLELMDKFGEENIPLSVGVLDMDWHLVDDPRIIRAGQSGWTGYTWNRELFPDPPAFIRELHKRKLKVTLNEHPADGIHSYEDLYEKMAKALNHDTSEQEPIPFNITDPQFLKAYFGILIKSLEDDGVDFWWIDWQQGTYSRIKGVDPLWMLNHYHFFHNARRTNHPMIFSRYAGPGSHRYPVGFSGDTYTTWASLDFQPEFTATASNIGYGWWSHDIGGHMLGIRDDDLMTRWVQFGVFSPIMRLHSTKSLWQVKEPWRLPQPSATVIADFLRLRHRLLPYLHTMNFRSATKGEPIVQPIYWEYPYRDEAYRVKNQYFFGSQLIIIPITTPMDPKLRLGKVKAWLPPGRYVDFFSGIVYDGDKEIWLSRSLDRYPVFMKEGSILPLDQSQIPANGGGNPKGFEIVVTVGADGEFEILEDDESSDPSHKVRWRETPIRFSQASGTLQIGPSHGWKSSHDTRGWTIRLLGIKEVNSIEVFADAVEKETITEKTSNGLLIHLGEIPSHQTVVVNIGNKPQFNCNDSLGMIFRFLTDAQIEYNLKDQIWQAINGDLPVLRLNALEINPSVLAVILEYLLADGRT